MVKLTSRTLPFRRKSWCGLRKWGTAMSRPPPVNINITANQFKKSVKGCNENTSTSPLGFGCVVWKAFKLSAIASRVHIQMTSFPFATGYAQSRWKQCWEVILEKYSGNPMIHILQIIVLLESDISIPLQIIRMRHLFTQAENMGFCKEQRGHRNNKNSTDCSMMKTLTKNHCVTCAHAEE